jgi:hypothetical protein
MTKRGALFFINRKRRKIVTVIGLNQQNFCLYANKKQSFFFNKKVTLSPAY